MRALLQRAMRASVRVDGELISGFDSQGIVALVGATHTDGPEEIATIVRKIAELRILDDEKSVQDVGAPVIVVSQFTLYGDTKKGRRPSWNAAAPADIAEPLVDQVVAGLRDRGISVGTGVFGANMQVELINDGPITIMVEA